MTEFIGRKSELQALNWLLGKKTASLVVVKGRRRIGKSRLVEEFAKKHRFFNFCGLPPTPGITDQDQRDNFAGQLAGHFGTYNVARNDWVFLFSELAAHTQKGEVIILFDEISWMATDDKTFLGKLKNSWDTQFKNNSKLILILCGSISAWIEKNILKSTGFLGRISSTIDLEQLSLKECSAFWGKYRQKVSAYEKFKFLGIIGGIPRYLEEIRPEINIEENIKKICFSKTGFLFNEFEQIFSSIFLTRSSLYKQILILLSEKKQSAISLCRKLKIEQNNVLTSYLDELKQAGFISRDHTWDIKRKTNSRLSKYRIKDNYIRFYLKYIEPKRHLIEKGNFQEISITTLNAWSSIMGLQFENLVLNNAKELKKLLYINESDVLFDGPYFQTQTKKTQSCQIDYMIQDRFNSLYICEIKFSKDQIGKSVIKEVKEKIKRLNLPKNFSYRPIIIHVNGVKDEVIEETYFASIIDFGQLI